MTLWRNFVPICPINWKNYLIPKKWTPMIAITGSTYRIHIQILNLNLNLA